MSLTVAKVQAILARRCGSLLTAAGLDGSATSTAWLDPIAASARELGWLLADSTTVIDDDLAPASASQDAVIQLLDVAELRSLESALENYTKVDQAISYGKQDLGQLRPDLEKIIERKATYVLQRYGIGGSTIFGGVYGIDFAEQMDNAGNILP